MNKISLCTLVFLSLAFLISEDLLAQDIFTWKATRPSPGGEVDITYDDGDGLPYWDNMAHWERDIDGLGTIEATTSELPDENDIVIIASGTNVCYIRDFTDQEPDARSITIESDAAIYNKSSLGGVGEALTIKQDLIIQDDGYYFGEAESVVIERDLIIEDGTSVNDGGAFIILNNINRVEIGRNFVNQGLMGKRQVASTQLNVIFNTNVAGYIYADGSFNNNRNTYVEYDLATRPGFDFQSIIGGGGPTYPVLGTGAFDRVEIDKNQSTFHNNGSPTVAFTSPASAPFMVGVEGDGINDFDGVGGTDLPDIVISSGTGSGNLTISAGSLIIQDVTGLSNEMVQVWDGSRGHPRGGENGNGTIGLDHYDDNDWVIPPADIDVRGNLQIENAQVGTGSYNGASLDLYNNGAAMEEDYCLHLGGNLIDKNLFDATEGATTQGFYIGPSNQINNATSFQRRPFIVFDGINDQSIEGNIPNIRDYNNIANQGQGMVLPNVIIHKADKTGGTVFVNDMYTVSIASGTNLRIFGDLTIYSGEFRVNDQKLLFADYHVDEINVMSIGNPTNATPDNQGRFQVQNGASLLLASTNFSGTYLSTGSILRGRRGGEVILEGTVSNPIEVSRESRPGGRIRMAMYSGCYFKARHGAYDWPSHVNTIGGSPGDVEYTTYQLATTDNGAAGTDNNTGGTTSRGGLKIYDGVILYDYASSSWDSSSGSEAGKIHSLSNCYFTGANQTNQSIFTFNTTGRYRIIGPLFNNYLDGSLDHKNIICNNSSAFILVEDSFGNMGGSLGDDNDAGDDEANVTWASGQDVLWQGDVSTSWADYRNWQIPDIDGSTDGDADNPNALVPGIAGVNGITDVSISIPNGALNNCVADVAEDILIEGSILISEPNTIGGRRLTLDLGTHKMTVQGDVFVYYGGTLQLNPDEVLEVAGNFTANYTQWGHRLASQTTLVSNVDARTDSKVIFNGAGSQQLAMRHNDLSILEVDKPSGIVTIQGISSWLTWNARFDYLIIKQGHVRPLSDTPLDIKRGFQQTGGIFEPLKSSVTFRGEFNAQGGEMIAGSDVVRFYPLRPSNTLTGNQDIWEITSTANHIFNELEFGDEGDGMVQRFFPDHLALGLAWHPDDREGISGFSEDNTVDTYYYLKSDFSAVGTMTVRDNRILVNQGHTLEIGSATFESGSRFYLNSTNSNTGELQVSSGGAINFNDGSRLYMVGEPTRFVKITRADVAGRYTFNIDGNVTARYYVAEYMDTGGIDIGATATGISPGRIVYGGGGQNYENPTVTFTSIYEGTGAAATVAATGTPLTGVVITNEGTGYTALPTVTPSTPGATFNVTMQGSPLNEITVSSPGTGYSEASGAITVAIGDNNGGLGAATPASANAIVSNEVTALTIGTNDSYTSPPTVTIDAPTSAAPEADLYRAEAVANLTSSNLLVKVGITMINNGVNYVDPKITLISADGNTYEFDNGDAACSGCINISASGEITDFDITAAMSAAAGNFTFPITASVIDQSGPGGDAEVNIGEIEVVATTINDFTITNGGAGYSTSVAPAVTVAGAATATATITGGDEIVGVVITDKGANYIAVPSISISTGSGATTDVSFDAGRITDITVATGGTYLTIPDLTITAPGSGVTATAFAQGEGGRISTFSGIVGGTNYRTAPLVTINDTGNGFGAKARAILADAPIARFNVLNGGAGYNPSNLPDIRVTRNYGSGSDQTVPAANITIGNGVIQFVPDAQITAAGTGYTEGDVLTALSPPGVVPEFIVTAVDASNGVRSVTIKDGGTAYLAGDVLAMTGGSGAGAQITLTAGMLGDGVIKSISTTGLTGIDYSTSPEVWIDVDGDGQDDPFVLLRDLNTDGDFDDIDGSGNYETVRRADIKVLLETSTVTDIELVPEEYYPVASFSDGIITNTAYGGTAFTFDDDYETNRNVANTDNTERYQVGNIYPNATGTFSAADAGITNAMHEYNTGAAAADFDFRRGPRIDTIYNVVFAQNPIQASNAGGSDPFASFNVRRSGGTGDATHRIVFRDAIGTFSGEQFDNEDAITTIAANSVSFFFNPDEISSDAPPASGSAGSLEPGMVDWVDLNVVRWDGGPDNTGTLWSEDRNWRPDGVPSDFNDVIIDYSLLNVDYETNNARSSTDPDYGRPILIAPNPLNIIMDFDYTTKSSASCNNLIFNSLVSSRVVGGASLDNADINITVNRDFKIGGTISMDKNTTMDIGQDNLKIEVGESWSNAGTFNNGGANRNNTVSFYKDVTRTVVNTLDSKDANANLTGDRNAFYNVSFVQGITDLGSDILVKGDLVIEPSPATLNGAERFLYLEGDWTNRGTFLNNNSTVYFRGTDPQVVSKEDATATLTGASLKEDFFNMTVNTIGTSNVAGAKNHVYLGSRLELNTAGSLTMLNGRIVSDTDKELILGETSTVTLPANPRLSYVQGPVGRLTDNTNASSLQALSYPVGSEKALGSGATFNITTNADGRITGATVVSGGTDFEVDQLIEVPGGTGGLLKITAVTAGVIDNVSVESPGQGYTDATGVTGGFLKGSGQAIYVGADENAVVLNASIDSPADPAKPNALFVVEQVEEAATTNPSSGHPGRGFPTSTSFNYVSSTRHWTVRNLPYAVTGAVPDEPDNILNTATIGLSYQANEEFIGAGITNSGGSTIDVNQNANVIGDEMKNVTIWKDGGGNTTYGIGTVFTPSYTETATTSPTDPSHNDRLRHGTAHSSNEWLDVGASPNGTLGAAVTQKFITSSISFGTLNDGVFALAFEVDPLPLEVLNLEATLSGNEVFVDWITVSEAETDFFVVERSTDGVNFSDIGTVEGQGINAEANTYRFIDDAPMDGLNYYRLRQVNQDGTIDYSTIVYVNVANGEAFTVFPNPVEEGGILKALIPSVEDEKVSIELVDVTGKVILNQETTLQDKLVEMTLPNYLNEGLYILRVITDTNIYQAKVMIQ